MKGRYASSMCKAHSQTSPLYRCTSNGFKKSLNARPFQGLGCRLGENRFEGLFMPSVHTKMKHYMLSMQT